MSEGVATGWRGRVSAWWTILRIALEERLVYRGDFALGTLMRFLPIITQIFLWWAVFETVPVGADGKSRLVGYGFSDMVAYYLLTMMGRAFSSMPGLATGIARQIRDGEVKKYLVQPIDMLGFLFWARVAHKLAYYSVAAIPFGIVFFLCRGYFERGWPATPYLAAFIASLLMAFVLGFLVEACLGLVGFWMLEISSLLFLYMLFSFFLSGHMFPLDMLPQPIATIVNFLPLKYLAYFPATVFLEKVPIDRLGWELLVQALWTLLFFWLARTMYQRGVRRYSGFGG
jgi:ABC-2 type transport system permease protein